MFRRILVMAAAALVVFAGTAGAQEEYDGTSGSATVSGDTIQVQAGGFAPNTEVNYEVDFTPDDENAAASLEAAGVMFAQAPLAAPAEIVETGTATTDADGNVSFAVANQGAGTYEITITDGTNTAVVGLTIEGDGTGTAAETDTGGLVQTGSEGTIGMTQVGVVLVVLGALGVYFAKRRRNAAFTD